MDSTLLHTFLDVIETRNFNQTAARLEITQSTVSHRIKTLEHQVGATLFERGRGGAVPTASGQRFADHARQLLASWTHALRDIGVRQDHDRMLRLSVQLSLQSSVLVDWAIALRADRARLALDLQSDYSGQIMRDVSAGHADIGVMFAPQMQPDLRVRREGQEAFQMMSTHAANLSEVDPAHYYRVGYTDGFSRSHDTVFPDLAAAPISVGNETLAIDLMSRLGGTAFLPARMAKSHDIAGFHPVEDVPAITQPVYSVVHRNRKADHDVTKALQTLRQCLSNTTNQ